MLDKFLIQITTMEMKIKEMRHVKQNTLHTFLKNLQNKLKN